MNIREIDAAGIELRALAREVQEYQAKIGDTVPADAGAMLTKLTERTARIGSTCDGGIEHRINQSRYYVAQYESMLEGFRFDRVDGFQRYDDFIKRRLYPAYQFIDMLGERLSDHKNNLNNLAQQIQTKSFLRVETHNQ